MDGGGVVSDLAPEDQGQQQVQQPVPPQQQPVPQQQQVMPETMMQMPPMYQTQGHVMPDGSQVVLMPDPSQMGGPGKGPEMGGMPELQPSKVIHFRNVGPEITQNDLATIATPFGVVTQVIMLRSKNQALLQFQEITSAMNFMSYHLQVQASVRSRNVYPQFSSHQSLSNDSMQPRHAHDDSAPPNRILLVSIANPLYPITVDVLSQVFLPHGTVEKIVIFNKAAGLQALVQYANMQQAISARQLLQDQNIYPGSCSLHIQFSNLKELTVNQNTDRTRDLTNPNLPTGRDQISMMGMMNQHGDMGQMQHQMGHPHPGYQMPGQMHMGHGGFPGVNNVAIGSGGATDHSVLIVSNLNTEQVNCDVLFNLFSNYGNIVRIKILHNKPDHALVQMGDNIQSTTAMNFLKGLVLFGKPLEVNYSRHSYIASPPEGASEPPNSKDYSTSPLNRFIRATSKNYKHICAPSSMLHVSNLGNSVTESVLAHHFGPFGDIQGMKFFDANGRRQALVQYHHIAPAAEALCMLHNQNIEGQNIRVSFSKNTL